MNIYNEKIERVTGKWWRVGLKLAASLGAHKRTKDTTSNESERWECYDYDIRQFIQNISFATPEIDLSSIDKCAG